MSSTNTPAERKPVKPWFLHPGDKYDIYFNELWTTGKYIDKNDQSATFELYNERGIAGTISSFPIEGSTFYKHVPTEQEFEHGDEQESRGKRQALIVPSGEEESRGKRQALIVPSGQEEINAIANAIEMLGKLNGETDYIFEFINGKKVGKYLENDGTTTMFCQVPGSGIVSTPLSWLISVENVSA